jgi:hypothetical protein
MNLFKGLFYLPTPAAPEFGEEPHYGAATAASEFGRELGNHAVSERWFGHHDFAYEDALIAQTAAVSDDEPRAARAASESRRNPGKHAASERWFGHNDFAYEDALIARSAAVGGCG